MTVYYHTINMKDTAANFTSYNPTLASGAIGHETDTGKIKTGDGATAWNSLLYTQTEGQPIDAFMPVGIEEFAGADGDVHLVDAAGNVEGLLIGSSSSTVAAGFNLSRTITKDDNGAALYGSGSVPDIKSGISRFLVTTAQTAGHVRLFGFQGMIAAQATSWNTELCAGVEGVMQIITTASKTFGGYGISAGLAARMATGAGTVVIDTNHIFAGVASISDMMGTVTQTGKSVAFLAAKYDTTNWSDATSRAAWKYAFYCPSGAATNGILMSASTSGISSTVTAYPAAQWGDSAHVFKCTAANPYNENGAAGYFETDVTGTVAGNLYGFGSWVNFNAACTTGAHTICAQDNGIYGVAAGTYTNTKMVIGMRMELVSDSSGGCTPGSLYLFSTNIYGASCAAIIDVNDKSEIGWVTGVLSGGGGCHVPLFKERGTTTYYVNCYTS